MRASHPPSSPSPKQTYCPCGSGDAYQQCCNPPDPALWASTFPDPDWQKIRYIEGTLISDHILPYVQQTFSALTLEEAWFDFLPEDLEIDETEAALLHDQLFLPWFVFDWAPSEVCVDEAYTLKSSIAETYLYHQGHKLNEDQKAFLRAMAQTYYSFYEVIHVVPDESVTLRDLMLGTEHKIKEKVGLEQDQIIFTRILSLDNQSVGIGWGPRILSPNHLSAVLEMGDLWTQAQGRPLTPDDLRNPYAEALRALYIQEMHSATSLPTLYNTDNELMVPSQVKFKLKVTPEEAFHLLSALSCDKHPEDFLNEAKRNRQGEITTLHFPWQKRGNAKHKDWPTTVLGHITLRKGKLSIAVNSEQRATKIQQKVQTLMKDKAIYQGTYRQPLSAPSVSSTCRKVQSFEASASASALESDADLDEDANNLIDFFEEMMQKIMIFGLQEKRKPRGRR